MAMLVLTKDGWSSGFRGSLAFEVVLLCFGQLFSSHLLVVLSWGAEPPMRHCILFFGDSLQWLLLNSSQFSLKVQCFILAGALEHELNIIFPNSWDMLGWWSNLTFTPSFFRGGRWLNHQPGFIRKKPCVAGCCTSYSKSSYVRTPAEPIDGFGTVYNWLVVWNMAFLFPYIWVNYNDLTTTSLQIMVYKGNHPQMALIQVSEIL